MPQNVINLYARLLAAEMSENELDSLIRELNIFNNKGVVLKRWDFLLKGERWKWEDLDKFMKEYGYIRDKNNKYNKEIKAETEENEYEYVEYHQIIRLNKKENITTFQLKPFYINNPNVTIKVKNRRELLSKFYQLLPRMVDRLLCIDYYKLPDFKKLYEKRHTFTNAEEYEKAHRYGDRRRIIGKLLFDNGDFVKSDGYYLIEDFEDEGKFKKIIIRNLISFTFDNVKCTIE